MKLVVVVLFSYAVLAAPLAAEAQQAKEFQGSIPGQRFAVRLRLPLDSFRAGLRELGYVEGHSVVIESRFADGKQERVQGFVRDLLALAADVVVAAGPQPTACVQAGNRVGPHRNGDHI